MQSFFLSHAKSATDAELEDALSNLKPLLDAASRGQPYRVTLARDDYKTNFERCGSWDEWMRDVLGGIDFASSRPRFDAFIAFGRMHGKGSATLLHRAFAERRPVVVFEQADGNWTLSGCWRVVQVSESFTDGYRIE